MSSGVQSGLGKARYLQMQTRIATAMAAGQQDGVEGGPPRNAKRQQDAGTRR